MADEESILKALNDLTKKIFGEEDATWLYHAEDKEYYLCIPHNKNIDLSEQLNKEGALIEKLSPTSIWDSLIANKYDYRPSTEENEGMITIKAADLNIEALNLNTQDDPNKTAVLDSPVTIKNIGDKDISLLNQLTFNDKDEGCDVLPKKITTGMWQIFKSDDIGMPRARLILKFPPKGTQPEEFEARVKKFVSDLSIACINSSGHKVMDFMLLESQKGKYHGLDARNLDVSYLDSDSFQDVKENINKVISEFGVFLAQYTKREPDNRWKTLVALNPPSTSAPPLP